MNILSLIGRRQPLFEEDLITVSSDLRDLISKGRFLVIGGAGSIGQAVTREIFKHDPRVLHVVDISENNMVELVRDLRSSAGYGTGDFMAFLRTKSGNDASKKSITSLSLSAFSSHVPR